MRTLGRKQTGNANPKEETLVRRAVEGDAEAFADLYEQLLGRVFRYFYYRVGQREDAEDLTEQVFLKAWQAIGGFDRRGLPFAAWIFRIAHNLMIDTRRSHQEHSELDDALELEDCSDGPEELVLKRLEAQELAAALGHLAPLEQSVVVLRFIERLDHRTVAGIVGKSEVATRTIQSRALVRLSQVLGRRDGGQQ